MPKENSKTLIAIVGPTAIGKTALSIELAKHFSTEIISADSRQFYKEMRIGTAVPSENELSQATHHFIQNLSISEDYSVGDFESDALNRLEEIFKKNTIAIMVGGSGLYVEAVTKGLDSFPKVDATIRKELNATLEDKGIETLQKQLKELDPDYFEKVDESNPHRVIRALEICIGTGKPYSTFLTASETRRPFKTIYIGLDGERETIYKRINKRVDLMVENGLVEEAKDLLEHRNYNALNTVGYKELFNYFDGEWTLDFAVSEIKKNTRRFAKRQLTWLRKNKAILWFDFNTGLQKVINTLTKKLQQDD